MLLLILTLLGTLPATAQRRKKEIDRNRETPQLSLEEKLQGELLAMALDFWTLRLNDYKNRIDRTLSPADLAEVNRLRVFWSVFAEEKKWTMLGEGIEQIFDGGTTYEYDEETGETKEIEKPKTGDPVATIDKISEMAETFFVAKWIARRYRPEFTQIRETLVDDIGRFANEVVATRDRLMKKYAAELKGDSKSQSMLKEINKEDIDKALSELRAPGKESGMIMQLVIDPIIMLYNGQNLQSLLKEIDVLPKDVTAMASAGSEVLKANTPNPASKGTTVSYTLAEPSSATTLRLYNSTGELVGTYDQGPRPAGDNSVEVDVSNLAAGTYIYHLTVGTPNGERVYSRAMQVVR